MGLQSTQTTQQVSESSSQLIALNKRLERLTIRRKFNRGMSRSHQGNDLRISELPSSPTRGRSGHPLQFHLPSSFLVNNFENRSARISNTHPRMNQNPRVSHSEIKTSGNYLDLDQDKDLNPDQDSDLDLDQDLDQDKDLDQDQDQDPDQDKDLDPLFILFINFMTSGNYLDQDLDQDPDPDLDLDLDLDQDLDQDQDLDPDPDQDLDQDQDQDTDQDLDLDQDQDQDQDQDPDLDQDQDLDPLFILFINFMFLYRDYIFARLCEMSKRPLLHKSSFQEALLKNMVSWCHRVQE